MRALKSVAFVVLAFACAATASSAEVRVNTGNGRVTIIAKDATLRQILTEWARVGQITVVNLERIPGGPMTLELTNVPETQALETLLRSVSGYVAAAKTVAMDNTSTFGRIVVVPTTPTPRAVVASAPQPTFTPVSAPADDDVDDERPAPPVGGPIPNPRGPVFNQFPQPQVVTPQPSQNSPFPQQPAQPGSMPTATPASNGGVSVPGMIAAPPPQPGQPGQGPGVPVKRPGGGPEGPDSH